jgi:hypothetical protein
MARSEKRGFATARTGAVKPSEQDVGDAYLYLIGRLRVHGRYDILPGVEVFDDVTAALADSDADPAAVQARAKVKAVAAAVASGRAERSRIDGIVRRMGTNREARAPDAS